jgi:ATP-dependent helicase/nuclease subunit A
MTSSSVQPAYRIDGAPVDAAAFYATACHPAASVVVEACAGAGKTWMLVSRILRALIDGAEPQQILAITFTRKAAGEMRERLDDWLREFAHAGEAACIEALCQRGMSASQAQAAAPLLTGLHERLLMLGRGVEIRTFHGWFSQLLQAAPMDVLAELGLAPGVELLEDPQELAAELFRRFHGAVQADAALRDDFFALVRERGRSSVRKWLEAAWARRVEFEGADAAGSLDASVPAAAACWPAFAPFERPEQRLLTAPVRALLEGVARGLGAQAKATPRKQGAALEAALALPDAGAMFTAARGALFSAKGEPRAHLDAPGLPEALALLDEVQRAVEQQQAHVDHGRMVRLARALLREYAAVKRQRGVADMADLEGCALHLLRDSALAGWVQERLDQRIRHVLIDEFQDTSPLQWRALHSWLAAYAGAGGGASGQRPLSVFIVGDPKQSIYRFRGAEPRVFAAAREFVADALGGAVLACDHTRRNAPELLDALNEVFDGAQAQGRFDGFRAHTTGAAAGGEGVQCLPKIERPARDAAAGTPAPAWRDSLTQARVEPEEGLRQREAAQVADAVQALLADGLPSGEIFVLARKRAPLRQVALALQARGVPHAAPEDNLLMGAPEVRDLVALLDALASPTHDLSLAQALRSPLFGATDDDLLALAERAEPGRWWAVLQAQADALSPALQRAARLLAAWAGALHRLPPHDLLDRVVHEGELLPRLLAVVPASRRVAAQQAVRALLALALRLDGARYASVYGFVRALKRRALTMPAAASPDAVQLLTVHGAKGLEAQAVIVMDADTATARAETMGLLVDWPVDDEAPRCCAFVASESRCPPSLRALLEREQAARAREEVNGLYVAMTRARRRLLLSAVAPHPAPDPGAWWAMVAPHAQPWAPPAPCDVPKGSAVEVVIAPALPRWRGASTVSSATVVEAEAQVAASRRAKPPGQADDPDAARLGEALHRVLEWATQTPEPSLEALCAAAGASFGLDAPAQARLLGHARTVLGSAAARRFFDPAGLAWAGNEVTVADGEALLRIDRLVAFDDDGRRQWWVLDYKLQSAPGEVAAYRAQIARYRTLVQALQPGDEVCAAFITAAGQVVPA